MSTITLQNNSLVVQTPYNPGLIADLKAGIPATERKYDPAQRAWVVAARHGQLVASLIAQYLGEAVLVPQVHPGRLVSETRILEIRYVGMTKAKEGYDQRIAMGYSDNGWNVVFPESVLKNWFMGITSQAYPITLYGVLGVARQATDDEIKAAFRRLARVTHPDVNKEPDAQQQFIKIKNAYDVLTTKRARYDAGLALEATLSRNTEQVDFSTNYRSPLRCGLVLADGIEQVGRFMVQEIKAWEDIFNSRGQVLVTSWPMGAQSPIEVWA